MHSLRFPQEESTAAVIPRSLKIGVRDPVAENFWLEFFVIDQSADGSVELSRSRGSVGNKDGD